MGSPWKERRKNRNGERKKRQGKNKNTPVKTKVFICCLDD